MIVDKTSPTLETVDPLSSRTHRGRKMKPAERLLEQAVRLRILKELATTDSLTFTQLRAVLNTTDGNVSVHTRKLEGAGFLVCEKTFAGRIPRTEYRLTATGREVLDDFLIRDAKTR